MRLLVLPDVHGLPTWRDVLAAEPAPDHVVFLGDYFDAFDVDVPAQLANFEAVLDFAAGDPARVTLLLGNHDYHYLDGVHERYSGYSFKTQRALIGRLEPLVRDGVLRAAFAADGRLYTHAGVTRTWAEDWELARFRAPDSAAVGPEAPDWTPASAAAALDALLVAHPAAYAYQPPPEGRLNDPYGDRPWQGPLWVRPRSLIADALVEGQIVGHTVLPKGQAIAPHPVAFSTDALWDGQYLVVEDGVALPRRLS